MINRTLDSVSEAFERWRSERKKQKEGIPENLWMMAMGLYPEHKRTTICRHLGLNGGQFKARLERINCKPLDTGFVLAFSDASNPNRMTGANVQLTLQGGKRTLKISVGIELLSQVLPHLEVLL